MRHAKEHERGARVKAVVFFTVLAVFLVLSLILPLRPISSPLEKREHLTKFPEFSQAALLDGSFFRGIDTWFADTFPGRELWFRFNRQLRSLYGFQTVEIHGEVQQGDDIPDAPFTGK